MGARACMEERVCVCVCVRACMRESTRVLVHVACDCFPIGNLQKRA